MGTLYIDRRGTRLQIDNNALICYEADERIGTIPLAPLERIFMRGEVELTASTLAALGQRGIGVIIISGQGQHAQMLMPNTQKDATKRIRQYQASLNPSFCLQIAKTWVQQKIRNTQTYASQQRLEHPQHRYDITQIINKLTAYDISVQSKHSLDTLRGLEGTAAMAQFKLLALIAPKRLGFTGRNRRPPKDPLNAVLSLGYTMLNQEAALASHGAGLDPAIGFYHQLKHGRDSLACDLMEPCRPYIDEFAINLFTQHGLELSHFTQHPEKGCQINKEGRAIFYLHYQELAETLRKQVTQHTQHLLNLLPTLPEQTTEEDTN